MFHFFKSAVINLFVFVVLSSLNLYAADTSKHSSKPNILFIVSDDLNTTLGSYTGMKDHTPNLDRLAMRGVRFTHAYSQYPMCDPSRPSFMSGLYPETLGFTNENQNSSTYRIQNPSLANHPSIAAFLRNHGYYTARVSKIYHMAVPYGIEHGLSGVDEPNSWDFTYNTLAPERQSPGVVEFFSPKGTKYGSYLNISNIRIKEQDQYAQADYLTTSQAIAILQSRAGSRIDPNGKRETKLKPDAPFFLAVGLIRPHGPFIAPENCFERYPAAEIEIPEVFVGQNVPEQALRRSNALWQMTEQGKQRFISGYLAGVCFMDQQVGRLLNALDRLKLTDSTIVIFTSDHGFNLGEHDSWNKPALWESTLRVPMIIASPKYKKTHNTSSDVVTELIDIYPTIAELSGLEKEQPEVLQGKSLVTYISGAKTRTGEESFIAYTVLSRGEEGSIRTNRWRYTRWGKDIGENNEELYDYLNDPDERVNLVDNPNMQPVLKEMRKNFEQKKLEANGLW